MPELWPEVSGARVKYVCILFRLNYAILRPAIIYGIADRTGLSELAPLFHALIFWYSSPQL